MNGTAFDIFEQNGFTIIKAVGNDSLIMVYDPVTGIVRDINLVNGYSGAYCYSNYQTNLADQVGNYVMNSDVGHLAFGVGSGALVSVGVATLLVASGPVGWAIGVCILAGGLYASYCSSGLNDGWTTDKWVDFGTSVGLDLIPFAGFEAGAGKFCVKYVTSTGATKTVTNTVSENAEGYVLTCIPKSGDSYADGYVASSQYFKYNTLGGVTRVAFGFTKKEAIAGTLTGLAFDPDTEAIINDYNSQRNQYDSTVSNLSDYVIG